MKIVNYIERHNFCLNDLFTNSNRTEIQACELEERTFGTPCIFWGELQIFFRLFFIQKMRFCLNMKTSRLIHEDKFLKSRTRCPTM